jgi:hypothetical protein
LHVGRPCFVTNKVSRSLFQDVFVAPENGFVGALAATE